MDLRIGNGYDVHLLAPGLEFWLGGIKVEHTKGCVAHSDGDTLIHALCDAMLGALALGDIGKHFPDNSSEFKGIDSKILLARVNDLIKAKGYSLVLAKSTVLYGGEDITSEIAKIGTCIMAASLFAQNKIKRFRGNFKFWIKLAFVFFIPIFLIAKTPQKFV